MYVQQEAQVRVVVLALLLVALLVGVGTRLLLP